jgi:hypothetical protein
MNRLCCHAESGQADVWLGIMYVWLLDGLQQSSDTLGRTPTADHSFLACHLGEPFAPLAVNSVDSASSNLAIFSEMAIIVVSES